ncbi:hypothetical protein BHE74_00038982 [Ensete ventricosum]|nr:hypothetical protein BHE74_00038982 [Ensete ventricosum]
MKLVNDVSSHDGETKFRRWHKVDDACGSTMWGGGGSRPNSVKQRKLRIRQRHSQFGGEGSASHCRVSDSLHLVEREGWGESFYYLIPILYRCDGDYGAAKVMLRPASPGTGVIAGGAVRIVLEMAGVENALGKQLGSKNALNNARATVAAVQRMRQFRDVARERGIPMEELWL